MLSSLRKRAIVSFFCLAALVILTGCRDSKRSAEFQKLQVYSGAEQCTAPGKQFADDLLIRALNVKSEPAEGIRIRIVPENGSDLTVSPSEVVTEFGGLAIFKVTAGNRTGDQYLKVIPEQAPEKALSVRFVSGVEILGTPRDREGASGKTLKDAIGLRVWKKKNVPAEGVPVYLTSPLKLGKKELRTDAAGEVRTSLTLGEETSLSEVKVEISNPGMSENLRSITIPAMGLNLYKLLINVFGGLAIFVLGMKMMSDGLQKAAGEKLRSILQLFSKNCYVAIAAGAAVTAVVQSSSASTVMVIGFVNAGLLNLIQAIGIIFGANIGTTITAQIISFNIAAAAMPAIILGLILTFITWQKLRGWGETVLGFGLLFFGLVVMGDELKVISSFPSFVAFFKAFECAPVNGIMPLGSVLGAILVGIAATVAVQSSAAVIGIVFALASSGLLDVYTGVAIVLGSNIGTTITAQFAALAANRIAKQAALAHTMFNLIGVVVIVATFWIPWGRTGIPVFFYVVNQITSGNAFALIPQNVPRHIANAHTLFNVIATVILTPFIPLLAKFCEKVIPLKQDQKVKYQYLEPHLLDTPSIALRQSIFAIRKMLKKSWRMVKLSVTEHFLPCAVDEEKIADLEKREERIDRFQLEITDYLVKITRRSLSKNQAVIVPLLMHCTNDAERIADHTAVILELTNRLHKTGRSLSDAGKQEVESLYGILSEQAKCTIKALNEFSPELATTAIKAETRIQHCADEFEANHIHRLENGTCDAFIGVIFIELLAEFCKISRHLSNIAERVAQINRNYMKITAEYQVAKAEKKAASVPVPESAEE